MYNDLCNGSPKPHSQVVFAPRLARQLGAPLPGSQRVEIDALAEEEARYEIARQRDKGWKLVTRLDSGEGVFVRDDDVVGFSTSSSPPRWHKRLDAECARREITKRQIVTVALERYLETT